MINLMARDFDEIRSPVGHHYYDRLVAGCLAGTLFAHTAEGEEVATFEGLCPNKMWEIHAP